MPREFRELVREGGHKNPEKLFILSYEGDKTEEKYFNQLRNSELFNNAGKIEIIALKKPNKGFSNPKQIKDFIKVKKKELSYRKGDEFWLIIDKDDWESIHKINFDDLFKECEKEKIAVALSNPCFEIWFVLHFKSITEISEDERTQLLENKRQGNKNFIDSYLAKVAFPGTNRGYKKAMPFDSIKKHTYTAIKRAKESDNISGDDRFLDKLGTGIYRLVERLIKPEADI